MKRKAAETHPAPPVPLGPLALALAADAAYSAELQRLFGARAGDLRYTRAGAGELGTRTAAPFRREACGRRGPPRSARRNPRARTARAQAKVIASRGE